MIERQRLGGIAALLAAGTFIFGFALFVSTLSDYTTDDPTPAESVAFVADNQTALTIWYAVILIIFGIVLVPVVIALHDQLKESAPSIMPAATVFGAIWAGIVIASGMIANIGIGTVVDLHETNPAQAEPVWSAIDAVQNGLGGGNEITGGIWVLLVSLAALKAAALPRLLAYLGIVSGAAGIVTIIPALEPVGAIFGLGLIAWFIWTALVLLRTEPNLASRQTLVPETGD